MLILRMFSIIRRVSCLDLEGDGGGVCYDLVSEDLFFYMTEKYPCMLRSMIEIDDRHSLWIIWEFLD